MFGLSESEKSQEQSLTTLLDEQSRQQLLQLTSNVLNLMEQRLDSCFEANIEQVGQMVGQIDLTKGPGHQSTSVGTGAQQNEQTIASEERETQSTSFVELKIKASKFFQTWRQQVTSRVAEAVELQESTLEGSRSLKEENETGLDISDRKIDAGQNDKGISPNPGSLLYQLFPPVHTPLKDLSQESKLLIIHSILLLILSLERYEAPSRVLLLHLVSSLGLFASNLTDDEAKLAKGLMQAAKQMSGDTEIENKAKENSSTRKWKVGLASVAGAALIGVTGGLAAPLVAAGVGTVMGGLGLGATAAAGYLGAMAGSSVIVGGLFGAYGGRMTGQMMDRYAREVSDFAFLPVRPGRTSSNDSGGEKAGKLPSRVSDAPEPLIDTSSDSAPTSNSTHPAETTEDDASALEENDPQGRRLRVTIGITGWLTSKDEVTNPWQVLGDCTEVFALRFELEPLLRLGNSLDAMVSSAAWGVAKSELIKQTVFAGLADAAMWPMTILQLGRVVDNPFSVARSRADKAGEVLADALINKAQGERPVTLIGYSLGARVIYACLQSLARRHAFGLIETAIFIGAPCPSDTSDWRIMRSVVSGRLVNVYSENDYILGFLYRSSSMQYGVAGLQKIQGTPHVENIDVSSVVSGHLRYRFLVGSILTKIGYDDVDAKAVAEEEATFQKLLEKEKQTTVTDHAKHHTGKVLKDNPLNKHVDLSKHTSDLSERIESRSPQKQGQEGQQEDVTKAAAEEAQELEQSVHERTKSSMMESAWRHLPSRLQGSRETHRDNREV